MLYQFYPLTLNVFSYCFLLISRMSIQIRIQKFMKYHTIIYQEYQLQPFQDNGNLSNFHTKIRTLQNNVQLLHFNMYILCKGKFNA